jgi:hypothetical protein
LLASKLHPWFKAFIASQSRGIRQRKVIIIISIAVLVQRCCPQSAIHSQYRPPIPSTLKSLPLSTFVVVDIHQSSSTSCRPLCVHFACNPDHPDPHHHHCRPRPVGLVCLFASFDFHLICPPSYFSPSVSRLTNQLTNHPTTANDRAEKHTRILRRSRCLLQLRALACSFNVAFPGPLLLARLLLSLFSF